MSILDSFNLGDLFGALADEDITAGGTTAVMQLGKRVPYTASINGTKVNAYVTLQEANLTRLSRLLKYLKDVHVQHHLHCLDNLYLQFQLPYLQAQDETHN